MFLAPTAFPADAGNGTITGYVSNAASRKLLEGATIDVPQLGRSALTDATGRFTLDLPPGSYQVVASYLGLDSTKAEIAVTAGGTITRNFDLTTAIYKLDTFMVTGEREGQAAAITAQRNAPNVKNVVAIDAYGDLPNMNASELAVLLPGVSGIINDEGNYNAMSVRGMGPGLNTITVDDALIGSQNGNNRQTRIHTITGSMFESLELIKGQTPDKGADSLGGTINLKSRSPLSLREKRQITYNFSARWAPPFTQQIPLREQHRMHPLLNAAYQEVFGVFGGDRNLGVAVNLFYSEQAVGYFNTLRDWQNTTNDPAYLWDYRTQDNYNNRKQSSINVKVDYRLSAHTKLSLNTIYNDAMERFRLRYLFRAFTGNASTVPSATSGVIPGFTARVTDVRPVAASTIDITSQMSQFYHRQRHVSFEVTHEYGPWSIDYAAVASYDHINSSGGDGGVLVNEVNGVGWRLDRTQSDLYPQFIQTAGPSISDPASYHPASYNFAFTKNIHEPREVRANVRYKLPTRFALALKAGTRVREEKVEDRANPRRYNFRGRNSADLPTDPTIQTFGDHKTGLNIPAWSANAIGRHFQPIDPNLWSEDIYFHESSRFTGTRGVTEVVNAGYVMTEGKIGRTGFLAGVRQELTRDDSWGWTRTHFPSTAAQQSADPVGSAQRDYAGNRRELHGKYKNNFPSIHLWEDITANVKARLSWSNSFGRPPLTNLVPNETVNDTARTLTINNPSLRPEKAENWDASLNYYFEPVGNLSAGWFHKTIRDYFTTGSVAGTVANGNDNGYNGDYAGYTILTRANLGTAVVQGWELSYVQQFTFLPGPLKGLGFSTNYTLLDTHGLFAGNSYRRTGEVPGFIPRSGNVSVSWRYHKFSSRVTLNRVGTYIDTFVASGSGGNIYIRARSVVNLGLAYQLRPAVSLTMDVQNLFNEMQSQYKGIPDRLYQVYIPGTTITFGVSGRF